MPTSPVFGAMIAAAKNPEPIATVRALAAQRMRLHRQRRRDGLRCLTIELRETEIQALEQRGLLNAGARNDKDAVLKAFYEFLDQSLGELR